MTNVHGRCSWEWIQSLIWPYWTLQAMTLRKNTAGSIASESKLNWLIRLIIKVKVKNKTQHSYFYTPKSFLTWFYCLISAWPPLLAQTKSKQCSISDYNICVAYFTSFYFKRMPSYVWIHYFTNHLEE